MEYRQLGTSSLRVSVVGLGTNTFGPPRLEPAGVSRILDAALEQGITFVDTAPMYTQGQSEQWIGQALQGRRQAFVIATKFQLQGIGDHPVRAWIERETEASLR